MRDRFRAEAGQTAAEYLGLLLVIAAVIAVIASFGATRVVSGAVERATCTAFLASDCAPAPSKASVASPQPGNSTAQLARPAGVAQDPGLLHQGLRAIGAVADGAWNTSKALINGFVVGDAGEGYDTWWYEFARGAGQTASSVLVFGDMRDALIAASTIRETGGREGWDDLATASVGGIPVWGDGLRGGKAIERAVGVARTADRASNARRFPAGTWILPKAGGGAYIGDRWYTEHALERMAPRTPEVLAELEARTLARARAQGLEPGTDEFGKFWESNHPDPRNVPPMLVEAEIREPGSTNSMVVTNEKGDVVSAYPRGSR